MIETILPTLVVGYLIGFAITLLTMDPPKHERYLQRRLFMWPLYWAYLLVVVAVMTAKELRRG